MQDQRGFTFVELIVVMVIGVVVAATVTAAMYQLFTTTQLNREHMTAYRQVQDAGYWFSRDAVSAQEVTVDYDPATPAFITMEWVDWDGQSYDVLYTLVDGSDGLKELRRSFTVDGVVEHDRAVADFIDITTYNTTLSDGIDQDDDTITVVSSSSFPLSGVVYVEGELVEYTARTATAFTGCTRGAYNSGAVAHVSGAAVSCSPRTTCYWDGDVLTLVVTAQVGQQVATRSYQIEVRPYLGT